MTKLAFDINAYDRRSGRTKSYHVEVELDGEHSQYIRKAITPFDFVEVKTDKDGKLTSLSFPKWVYEF